jgi:hypothetical protein
MYFRIVPFVNGIFVAQCGVVVVKVKNAPLKPYSLMGDALLEMHGDFLPFVPHLPIPISLYHFIAVLGLLLTLYAANRMWNCWPSV